MAKTKIEWTDKTWNPVTGCTKKSEGCLHCYAEVMARRPHNIFVCSMGDLFHEKVPFDFIDRVMETIVATPQHRYQILTKRPERLHEYFTTHDVPQNVWLGTTVESRRNKFRIDYLRGLHAPVRFLSCEPLIEDLGEMDLTGINWVIVGGESGMQARPIKEDWIIGIKNQCEQHHIAFFFKQWGTWGQDGIKRNKHANGKLLQGEIIQQMPTEWS